MQETIYRGYRIRTCDNCHTFTVNGSNKIFKFCADAISYIDKIIREEKNK